MMERKRAGCPIFQSVLFGQFRKVACEMQGYKSMQRIKLTVAYDGTNYAGWQIQKNALAIEEVLNKAISDLTGEEIVVIGASRTDSGVHALGNVAVFDTESRIPGEKFSYALNQRLPQDIKIVDSKTVDQDFHPRYCDTRKIYRYDIFNRKFENPLLRLYSHFVYYDVDIEKMKMAARYLVGEHDFKSFCTSKTQVESTVRTIYRIDISKIGDMISVEIEGNGFLYNMVRIIVGTLLKVGMNFYPPEYVLEILEAKDRGKAGPKAPAKGLTLVEIIYE